MYTMSTPAGIRCIRVLGFFATEMDCGREKAAKSAKLPKNATEKRSPTKASLTFGRDMRPKVGIRLIV